MSIKTPEQAAKAIINIKQVIDEVSSQQKEVGSYLAAVRFAKQNLGVTRSLPLPPQAPPQGPIQLIPGPLVPTPGPIVVITGPIVAQPITQQVSLLEVDNQRTSKAALVSINLKA